MAVQPPGLGLGQLLLGEHERRGAHVEADRAIRRGHAEGAARALVWYDQRRLWRDIAPPHSA